MHPPNRRCILRIVEASSESSMHPPNRRSILRTVEAPPPRQCILRLVDASSTSSLGCSPRCWAVPRHCAICIVVRWFAASLGCSPLQWALRIVIGPFLCHWALHVVVGWSFGLSSHWSLIDHAMCGRLAHWVVDWPSVPSIGLLDRRLACWVINCLVDWLAALSTGSRCCSVRCVDVRPFVAVQVVMGFR